MSRIAKAPVELPAGVTATIAADAVTIKGAKGSLSFPLTAGVSVVQTDKKLQIRFDAEGLARSEEHTSELQSRLHLVCRLLLEKKKKEYYVRQFAIKIFGSNKYLAQITQVRTQEMYSPVDELSGMQCKNACQEPAVLSRRHLRR